MSVSQALDNVDGTQPEASQEGTAGVYQEGATGGGEGGARGSQPLISKRNAHADRSQTSRSRENLMAAFTFYTDFKTPGVRTGGGEVQQYVQDDTGEDQGRTGGRDWDQGEGRPRNQHKQGLMGLRQGIQGDCQGVSAQSPENRRPGGHRTGSNNSVPGPPPDK